MSLNINGYSSSLYNTQALDTKAIKDITSQILNAEETQTKTVDLDTLNLSKFNRVNLGVDLYTNKTTAQQASQIAVRNSDVDVNLNNQNFLTNVQYLKSQAALSAFSTTKEAEGKIATAIAEASQVNLKEIFAVPQAAQIFEAQSSNKDKKGSNPFSYQRQSSSDEETSSNESLSIFA